MSEHRSSIRVVVFAGGGPIALNALQVLARDHEIVAVVRAGSSVSGLRGRSRASMGKLARRLGLVAEDPVTAWAAGADVPMLWASAQAEGAVARRLRELRPDFGCIVTFPTRVSAGLCEASGRECINLHTSLLPRHRGRDPLFWTYHASDLEGGVTTHLAVHDFDAGPILGRHSCLIGRGEAVTAVHARYSAMGAALLSSTLAELGEGSATPVPQNEEAATQAPGIVPGRVYSQLSQWTAERAWHFLAGLAERYRDPLRDEKGELVYYRGVEGWEGCDPRHRPGSVLPRGSGWDAWACDGFVRLVASPLTVASEDE